MFWLQGKASQAVPEAHDAEARLFRGADLDGVSQVIQDGSGVPIPLTGTAALLPSRTW